MVRRVCNQMRSMKSGGLRADAECVEGRRSEGWSESKESVVIGKRREWWEKHESAEAGEADLV